MKPTCLTLMDVSFRLNAEGIMQKHFKYLERSKCKMIRYVVSASPPFDQLHDPEYIFVSFLYNNMDSL